ncbi:MAG: hypothetical protein ACYDIB_08675 [Desulfobulbia bacterium]
MGGTEEQKAKIELQVFWEFVAMAGIDIDPASIIKHGRPSEPDIYCTLNGEEVAYEAVEVCSPEIAATLTLLRKGKREGTPFSVSDPTAEKLFDKLQKSYNTTRPIELICYVNGRVISPDDVILSEARQCVEKHRGSFRKIWLLGEKGLYEIT